MKIRLVAAATIAGVATLLSSGAAHAGYPEPAITITIDDADIIGGTTFSYKAESGSVDCIWTVTYDEGRAPGEPAVQTGTGTSISGTYKTKVVSKTFKSKVRVVCNYEDGQTASSAEATTAPAFFSTSTEVSTVQSARQNAGASATVTLRPLGSGDGDTGSALPDTGGSNLSLFLLAGGLVLVGGGVTYMARRRQSNH